MKKFKCALVKSIVLLGLVASSACAEDSPIRDYREAKKVFWSQVYPEGGETLYCAKPFGRKHPRSINVEHVFPMGWVVNHLKCEDREICRRTSRRFNLIEADMHNFYPAKKNINKARGSLPFGMIKGEKRSFGKCDVEIDRKKHRVEPRESVRGDIARAMLYMSDKYGIKLFDRQKKLLEQWHRIDPPDEDEIRRNNLIAQFQGNHNTFIQDY